MQNTTQNGIKETRMNRKDNKKKHEINNKYRAVRLAFTLCWIEKFHFDTTLGLGERYLCIRAHEWVTRAHTLSQNVRFDRSKYLWKEKNDMKINTHSSSRSVWKWMWREKYPNNICISLSLSGCLTNWFGWKEIPWKTHSTQSYMSTNELASSPLAYLHR